MYKIDKKGHKKFVKVDDKLYLPFLSSKQKSVIYYYCKVNGDPMSPIRNAVR